MTNYILYLKDIIRELENRGVLGSRRKSRGGREKDCLLLDGSSAREEFVGFDEVGAI